MKSDDTRPTDKEIDMRTQIVVQSIITLILVLASLIGYRYENESAAVGLHIVIFAHVIIVAWNMALIQNRGDK